MKSILERFLVIDVESLKGCRRAQDVEKVILTMLEETFQKKSVYFINNNHIIIGCKMHKSLQKIKWILCVKNVLLKYMYFWKVHTREWIIFNDLEILLQWVLRFWNNPANPSGTLNPSNLWKSGGLISCM